LGRLKQVLRYPVIIDGRNLYSLEAMKNSGLMYVSMGRPTVQPSTFASKKQEFGEFAK
jgi:UDPglucose 6-dehydrogenase